MTWNRSGVPVGLALLAFLLVACRSAPAGQAPIAPGLSTSSPNPTSIPTATPPASFAPIGQPPGMPSPAGDACFTTRPSSISRLSGDPVRVDPSPQGLTILWIPGLNTTPCATYLDHPSTALAERLAADVNAAPSVAAGPPPSCAQGDYTMAELFFSPPRRAPAQIVNADLNGCAWMYGPTEGHRWLSTALLTDLASIAPPTFKPYLVPGHNYMQ